MGYFFVKFLVFCLSWTVLYDIIRKTVSAGGRLSCMYLKKTKRPNGRVTLSAVQGYRDPESGKSKQRSIETFGYVDELAKEFDDPVAHFTEVVATMEAERLAAEGPQTITIHPLQKADRGTDGRKSVGDAVPMAYYGALGIESAVRSNMRGRGCKFDANALLRVFVNLISKEITR